MKVRSIENALFSKALAFVVSDNRVTIRAFERVDSSAGHRDATEAEIAKALHEHGTPFKRTHPDVSVRYPSSLFQGSHDKSGHLSLSDEVCWSLDPAALGAACVSDHSSWFFMHSEDDGFLKPFNSTLDYLASRRAASARHADKQGNTVLWIHQPYADSTLDDCTVCLLYSASSGFHHNLGEAIPLQPNAQSSSEVWPRLRISGPATVSPDGYVDVSVDVLHPETDDIDVRCNSTLYLEDVEGYTPKSRAQVTRGRGSFRVGALGLVAGERVRVKVNWRNWVGDAEYIATVG